MKIETNIKSLLNATGKVVVPNLGTFTTAQASAELTEAGGVIAPPRAKIMFSEDTTDLAGYSLQDYLVASGQFSETDAELEIEAFVKGIKNTVENAEKAGLGAMGHFQQGSYGLEFVSNDSSNMGSDSFGLPKINARPLVPVPITDDTPMPGSGDKLLLKAILIPLIIISIVLVYFLVDKEAYQTISSYFSSDDSGVVVPPKKDDNTNLTDNTKNDTDNTTTVDGNDTDKSDGKGDDTANAKTDGTANPDKTDSNTNTKTPDDNKTTVVTSNTARFYIIIGSFTNDNAAQKAVNRCKRVGYSDAKILKMNNKIRVSVEDYTSRNDALEKAKKIGKDFPGAWVLAN
ncbi:MAG: SPOR domain-containing protein [Flammeovirgaceae bacterium]